MTLGAPWLLALFAAAAPARDDAKPAPVGQGATGGSTSSPTTASVDLTLGLRAREALQRGLAYLAKRQGELRNGAFPFDDASEHVPVPVTALAALAYMAGGSQPDRGPHGKEVAAAIDYLCAHAELSEGSARYGFIASDGDAISKMHGHGFATLALSQAFSMSPKSPRGERLARVLAAAVQRIEETQGLEGGWYYEPVRSIQHENSVTVAVLAALRGAHNVGVKVDSGTIARAVEYVRLCQSEDGSFRYGLGPKEPSSLALTAASLATLNAAGRYGTPEVERGMTHLWQGLESAEAGAARGVKYPYYERMYVAEALWHHPDARLYQRWMENELRRLLVSQAADGSWSDREFGACYATATNCLVLALPLGQLPYFQR
ncbi:MAG: terpene cyclase/mutase family protein [Planctomycetes bacterium]|nr:terpene cyclase/mutase family protein [Planctomycetota bacterium]